MCLLFFNEHLIVVKNDHNINTQKTTGVTEKVSINFEQAKNLSAEKLKNVKEIIISLDKVYTTKKFQEVKQVALERILEINPDVV